MCRSYVERIVPTKNVQLLADPVIHAIYVLQDHLKHEIKMEMKKDVYH